MEMNEAISKAIENNHKNNGTFLDIIDVSVIIGFSLFSELYRSRLLTSF